MKRIKLSKSAKQVFRLVIQGERTCPDYIFPSEFSRGAKELGQKGLLYLHEEESGEVQAVSLTDSGRLYVDMNPNLYNPIDWKWIIPTVLASITTITTLLLLFVACTKGLMR